MRLTRLLFAACYLIRNRQADKMTLKHELELKEKKLLLYEEMLKAGYGKEEITHKTGISRPTFYRWKRRYRDQGIKGLKDLSHRPHRTREKTAITREMYDRILATRNAHPMYGKEKIRTLLARDGISISASSIGRALRRMTDLGQALPVSVLRCRKERKRMRKFAPGGAQRLRKGDRPQVEIDHTIIFVRDTVFRVFVAYGRDSRVCVMRAYLNATSGNAARFMEHVCMEWPHRITEIQTDGGSEFRGELEEWNREHGIRQYVLPPRSQKPNGGVERFNQTLQDEYLLQSYNDLPGDEEGFNEFLERFQKDYNYKRPHRSLKDKNGLLLTPADYVRLKQSHML